MRKLENPKGDPLEVARIAGISAAKRTSEWILFVTHCRSRTLMCTYRVQKWRGDSTQVNRRRSDWRRDGSTGRCRCRRPYGVRHVQALDKSIEIAELYLVEKTGGKSGDFRRDDRRHKNRKDQVTKRSPKR